ncbi:hypothetical protein Tco_1061835 [Tanacetum coccineum]
MIPQQYILRHWTKNLIPTALRNKRNRYGEKNVVVENYANEATSIIDHCVHLLSKDEPRLGTFVEKLKSLTKEDNKNLRVKGGKEKAIEKSLKGRNSCSLCGVCQEDVVVQKEVCQDEVVQEKVDLAEDEEEFSEEDEDLIHE